MSTKKPLILISNDDGIAAPGIGNLISIMKTIGDVVVVAPDSPQSGKGHAITIGEPLRINKVDIYEGVQAYETSGTPADCVKLAKHYVLKDKSPDIIVSGINHGANSSVNVLYSGTMSAAIEGAIEGIPAIGFSVADFSHEASMDHCFDLVKNITLQALEKGIPFGTALNVNFPEKRKEKIKGVKVCRQARAKWQEDFDERIDPNKRKYYWMIGEFVNMDHGEDTDIYALDNNYCSIVPCQFDLSSHQGISELNEKWDFN